MSDIARKTFLLEVGVEEVPARMAERSARDLSALLAKELANARLDPGGDIAWFVTPRRLVAMAPGVPERQEDVVAEKRGPATRIAFNADGEPTRAGIGFARGQGLDPADLEVREHNGEQYVFARREEKGLPALELLPPILERCLQNLRFPKQMRWGRVKQGFVRPVHWLVALLDSQVVPFEFAGISAGNQTRGHRFHAGNQLLTVTSPSAYIDLLREHAVVVSPAARKQTIREGLAAVEAKLEAEIIHDEALLDEVTHLVENPVVAHGSFDEKFLAMPAEVLITSMKNHQKFFALRKGGKLSNHFAVVNNTQARDLSLVVRGNARVLTARLEDAFFFFREDQKRPLETYRKDLAGQTFLRGLGSMQEKAERVSRLAATLAAELFPDATETARRAGALCKADLATQMVFEFPELQGIMGRVYATAGGEPAPVAQAIYEHYLPRHAGDELPDSPAGMALALADRLDTVVGCFHLGLVPTATKDPYGLRRAVLAGVRILTENEILAPVPRLIELTLDNFGDTVAAHRDQLLADILEFVQGRLRNWLTADHATEVVDACLAAGFDHPFDVREKCRAVEALRGRPDYEDLIQPFKRVINITRKERAGKFDPARATEDAEKALWQAFQQSRQRADALFQERRFDDVLALFLDLKPPIDKYFDDVLVMCEDEALRNNRLAMLSHIGRLFLRFADFTRILV